MGRNWTTVLQDRAAAVDEVMPVTLGAEPNVPQLYVDDEPDAVAEPAVVPDPVPAPKRGPVAKRTTARRRPAKRTAKATTARKAS